MNCSRGQLHIYLICNKWCDHIGSCSWTSPNNPVSSEEPGKHLLDLVTCIFWHVCWRIRRYKILSQYWVIYTAASPWKNFFFFFHISKQTFISGKLWFGAGKYPKDVSANLPCKTTPLHLEPICLFQHDTSVWKQKDFGACPKSLHSGCDSLPTVISSLPT